MPFQKGHKLGKGRMPAPDDVREARAITKTQMLDMFVKFMTMDINSLEDMLSNRSRPVVEHIIGRVALMAIKDGDQKRLDFFMDRLYGKVTQEIKHTMPEPLYVEYGDGTGVALTSAIKQIDE